MPAAAAEDEMPAATVTETEVHTPAEVSDEEVHAPAEDEVPAGGPDPGEVPAEAEAPTVPAEFEVSSIPAEVEIPLVSTEVPATCVYHQNLLWFECWKLTKPL